MTYGNRSTRKRGAFTRIASTPLAVIAALIICIIMAKAAWGVHKKAVLSAEKLADSQRELAKLEERRDELSQKVEYLSSDEGIEAEIRLKYRALRPGESVAVVLEGSQVATQRATSTVQASWWRRWLQALGL